MEQVTSDWFVPEISKDPGRYVETDELDPDPSSPENVSVHHGERTLARIRASETTQRTRATRCRRGGGRPSRGRRDVATGTASYFVASRDKSLRATASA